MNAKQNLEERLEKLGQAISSEELFVENVMSRVDAEAIAESNRTEKFKSKLKIRRFIMSRFTKLTAAAAVIIIAIVLAITILDKSVPSAYAIEKTIEALRNIRFVHLVHRDQSGEIADERWIELSFPYT